MKPRNKAAQFLVLQELTNIRLRTLVKCLFGAYFVIYSMHVKLSLIEKDHLGDWSPEKDCC